VENDKGEIKGQKERLQQAIQIFNVGVFAI
jgi:hypothetical protein